MSLQVIFIISERSWRLGEVANAWRKTTVAPNFKKGKKDNLGNYRPVSLISVSVKICEQVSLASGQMKEKVVAGNQG